MTRAIAVIALLLAASAGEAAPLIRATWIQSIQGIDLTVTARDSGAGSPLVSGSGVCTDTAPLSHRQVSITCPAALLPASGFATHTSYSVSLTMPLFSLNQFDPSGVINLNTMATLMGSATIQGGLGSATANQGVAGMVTVRVAAHIAKGVYASVLTPAPTTLLRLPLSVGRAGASTGYFYVLTTKHYLTVDFYAWTPDTLVFTGLTSKAVPLPTLVAMGSVQLGAAGGGVVTLVAPSKISVDGPLAQRRTASFTELRLVFPEPSALLLLGAGGAGLALLRRPKRPTGGRS
jgi:hypothetical protein